MPERTPMGSFFLVTAFGSGVFSIAKLSDFIFAGEAGAPTGGVVFFVTGTVFFNVFVLGGVLAIAGATGFLLLDTGAVSFAIGFVSDSTFSLAAGLKVVKSLLSVRLIRVVLPSPQLDRWPGAVFHLPTSLSSVPSFS